MCSGRAGMQSTALLCDCVSCWFQFDDTDINIEIHTLCLIPRNTQINSSGLEILPHWHTLHNKNVLVCQCFLLPLFRKNVGFFPESVSVPVRLWHFHRQRFRKGWRARVGTRWCPTRGRLRPLDWSAPDYLDGERQGRSELTNPDVTVVLVLQRNKWGKGIILWHWHLVDTWDCCRRIAVCWERMSCPVIVLEQMLSPCSCAPTISVLRYVG